MKIYLASPYGFTSAGQEFMKKTMMPLLKKEKHAVLNPWDDLSTINKKIIDYDKLDQKSRISKLKILNNAMAQKNVTMIDKSDLVLAVLDGSDVDSGVAAEIGYAYAQNKKIFGYRSDFRLTGDNIGSTVNLQVEFFIIKSGGKIHSNLQDLKKDIKNA